MALLTLEEHDRLNTEAYRAAMTYVPPSPEPVGVQCPNCGGELVNPSPDIVIGGEPPRINVRCDTPDCRYIGTAVQHQ